MTEQCLTYYFGICIASQEEAYNAIFWSGIGVLVSLFMLVASFVGVLLRRWWLRDRAFDTIDKLLSGKPTKSRRYDEVGAFF